MLGDECQIRGGQHFLCSWRHLANTSECLLFSQLCWLLPLKNNVIDTL